MNDERSKLLKPALLGLALLLLAAAGGLQHHLNRLRADPELGLTRVEPLENAPPVLAFTTVALGAFRGLIANILWMRANDLQMEGKYFEMVQLADWITKLEPHFTQVWLMQAWNMAYNISVKFTDPEDRWRWVQQGIQLLRDDGLRYNPREALLYRELAWFFQHKMGQNMDNAHLYYKSRWADLMTALLGGPRPDFEALIDPPDDATAAAARQLREVYKLDPVILQEVDRDYGPLDWRLPEAHAIYWAVVGLKNSRPEDLITLRRVIYQSMQLATRRGRLWYVPTEQGPTLRLSPNLDLAERADAAFRRMIEEDEEMRHAIRQAHENFLFELIFLMYTHNRVQEAQRWMNALRQSYPDALPEEMTAAEYARRRLAGSVESLSHSQATTLIEGLITQSFYSLAIGEDDRAVGMMNMARRIRNFYVEKTRGQEERLPMTPLPELVAEVRTRLLEPGGMDPVLAAQLRNRLDLPPPAP